jgi:hypothetical protein
MNLLPFLLLLLVVSACGNIFETDIDFDDIHEPQLAVTALLDDRDSVHQIYVTTTFSPTEFLTTDTLDQAEVLVNIEDIPYRFTYNPSSGYYEHEPTLPFQDGQNWQLEVRVDGFPALTAQQQLPDLWTNMRIDTFGIMRAENGTLSNRHLVNFQVEFNEPEMSGNYYLFTGFKMGIDSSQFVEGGDSIRRPTSIIVSDREELHRSFGRVYINDDQQNGEEWSLQLSAFTAFVDTVLQVDISMYAITEERYFYDLQSDRYRFSSNDLFTEPVSTYTNIEQGVGIFSVSRSVEAVVR